MVTSAALAAPPASSIAAAAPTALRGRAFSKAIILKSGQYYIFKNVTDGSLKVFFSK